MRAFKTLVPILLLVGAGVLLWYSRLPLRRKQFVQNFLRQVPDLPARYQV